MGLLLVFWVCAGLLFYAYVGYPLLLIVVGAIRPRAHKLAPFTGSVDIVLAARNEEDNIERRVQELFGLLANSRLSGAIVVVSDGSTDRTAAVARTCGDGRVRVLEFTENQGKAAALNAGRQASEGDVLVFADCRQRWDTDGLERLLENFGDPRVGAVSGDLNLEKAPGVLAGIGLYWRFEKWLRTKESRVYSLVGVTGAISAARRSLFPAIPPGTLLDDVYWPLCIALKGYRVVHDPRARAFDQLPDNTLDEFQRKVRTLAGNFQLIRLLPRALFPWRNPIWLQWISHKILRLASPWALMGLLTSSWLLPGDFYQVCFWAQIVGYTLAGVGLCLPRLKLPVVGAATSFVVLNAAAFLAFWVWISGRAGHSWRPVSYAKSGSS